MKIINLTLPILCSFLGFLSLTGCNSNSSSSKKPVNILKKNYSMNDFRKIDLSGLYKVNVVRGDKFSVEIGATPDDHKLLSVISRNGVLDISYLKANTQNYPIEVNIVMPELDEFSIAGVLKLTKIAGFKGENLFVVVDGSADINVENCNYGELELELNGAGTIDALKSKAKIASATISGAGTILVNATEFLDAEVSGAGMIKYSGSPRLNASTSGVGAIKHI
jgi:hypothetical protein